MVMGLFKKQATPVAANVNNRTADLAARVLDSINEGVILVDATGIIQFANPAAATLAGYGSPSNIIGLGVFYILKLENAEGAPLAPEQNPFFNAITNNQSLSTRDFLLTSASGDSRVAVSLTCTPTGNARDYRIITFRDITAELAKEHEREDFISTASHEMRTPVASIEGYIGLALNPQTATIDDRAKQYLDQAHTASKHLGNLFRDLLDVTKLDDHRLQPHPVPVDAVEAVKSIADECAKAIPPRKLKYTFGTNAPATVTDKKHIEPKVYMSVDLDFLRAIMENLIGNAIKYTPDGGEIWVNVRGDGDKVLINVTDTGIGISADDISHLFQKFYRVDNSQTRQIGGTGLGLYLVKERVNAMGGRVWAESAFGDGSTFYVSLPRISDSDYQKLSIAKANEQMVQTFTGVAKPAETPAFQPITPKVTTDAKVPAPSSPAQKPTEPKPADTQPKKNAPVDSIDLKKPAKIPKIAKNTGDATDGDLAAALESAKQAFAQATPSANASTEAKPASPSTTAAQVAQPSQPVQTAQTTQPAPANPAAQTPTPALQTPPAPQASQTMQIPSQQPIAPQAPNPVVPPTINQ